MLNAGCIRRACKNCPLRKGSEMVYLAIYDGVSTIPSGILFGAFGAEIGRVNCSEPTVSEWLVPKLSCFSNVFFRYDFDRETDKVLESGCVTQRLSNHMFDNQAAWVRVLWATSEVQKLWEQLESNNAEAV